MTSLTVTAHHEAGHAVAAVMRGGSSLRSIDMENAHNGHATTWHRSKPVDAPFIAYAGPWAEARYQWPDAIPLDGLDDEGLTFDDHVAGVMLQQSEDAAAVAPNDAQYRAFRQSVADMSANPPPHYDELVRSVEGSGPYDVWQRELVRAWPAIQAVAARLVAGDDLEDDDVRQLVL